MFNARKSILTTAVLAATLGLSACGSSSSDDNNNNANVAPTNITLSAATIAENAVAAEVGTLTATDADGGETFTFSTTDARFEITGTTLKLKADTAIDFEQEPTVTVNVTVTDSASNTYSKALTIAITDELDFYGFTSRFEDGESTVSYSGQIARHLLIKELYNYIGAESGFAQDAATLDATALKAKLTHFYRLSDKTDKTAQQADYDNFWDLNSLTVAATPGAQTTLLDISSSYKDLYGKIAGNDNTGQHKNWNDGTSFKGWDGLVENTPHGLVDTLFDQLTTRALSAAGASTPDGQELNAIYVTSEGVDLKQLIQKFLLGAVAFSQGTDDYLDNDTDNKGLLTDNTTQIDGKFYTNLEHQWDEGFGYFGAARDYLNYSDDEIASKVTDDSGRADWNGYHDTNGDDAIDFKSEYNFGNSTNAAKRDRSATTALDLTAEAFNAFLQGRQLIANTHTAFTTEQAAELKGYATTATLAWEKSISATVIHYINDLSADLNTIKSGNYTVTEFETMAKHFSEMKGFALNLQFNPESPMNNEQFVALNDFLKNKPVITGTSEIEAYQADLLSARALLQVVYGFTEENVSNW